MRAAGALSVTTVTEIGAILARQNSAVFLVVLSCADSEPLRPQCNATKFRPCLAAASTVGRISGR
jgi:hypothetical protein